MKHIPYSGKCSLVQIFTINFVSRVLNRNFRWVLIFAFQCQETTLSNSLACEIWLVEVYSSSASKNVPHQNFPLYGSRYSGIHWDVMKLQWNLQIRRHWRNSLLAVLERWSSLRGFDYHVYDL